MPSTQYGSVPFEEQSRFFRHKLNMPTNHWADIYGQEHDWAFMVAGANRNSLLEDFRGAVRKAIDEGANLTDFRRDFDRIVADHGWDYNGGRNWRSRVIYETNLQSSYNAGRHEQMRAEQQALPYWRYRHAGHAVDDPRPEHVELDGLILRSDDPWWNYFFPPNGWGCQCYVEALTEEEVAELGGPHQAPPIEMEVREIGQRSPEGPRQVEVPRGIDPGFEHVPGQGRLNSRVPTEQPFPPIRSATGGVGVPNTRALDAMPTRHYTGQLLPAQASEAVFAEGLLRPFGATWNGAPVIYRDVMGEPLIISRELFRNRAKSSGEYKVNKNGRGPYMPLLAQTIIEPEEVWVRIEWHHKEQRAMIRRRYLARYALDGQTTPALAVFEMGDHAWSGITVYPSDTDINDYRVGVRVYQRGKSP